MQTDSRMLSIAYCLFFSFEPINVAVVAASAPALVVSSYRRFSNGTLQQHGTGPTLMASDLGYAHIDQQPSRVSQAEIKGKIQG